MNPYTKISLVPDWNPPLLYHLAYSVIREERAVVLAFDSWSSVDALMQQQFPDLYSWLCLHATSHLDWDLAFDDNKLVLIVCEELTTAFCAVWCSD